MILLLFSVYFVVVLVYCRLYCLLLTLLCCQYCCCCRCCLLRFSDIVVVNGVVAVTAVVVAVIAGSFLGVVSCVLLRSTLTLSAICDTLHSLARCYGFLFLYLPDWKVWKYLMCI